MRAMKESEIESYLVRRVKALGGQVRKVIWAGRHSAPDRVVMLRGSTIWVELKNPKTVATFPATPHEWCQYREHERMREMGQRVEVVGTVAQVDAILEEQREG